MVVVDFDEQTVTVDMNHPLAGKDLVFDVEIIDVREATPDEILHRHAPRARRASALSPDRPSYKG
ncbi:MAG: hypothetical protein Q9N34_02040 [Aquificota bacterium]|nr:hypothetical protein [Aquificota bacterium]